MNNCGYRKINTLIERTVTFIHMFILFVKSPVLKLLICYRYICQKYSVLTR